MSKETTKKNTTDNPNVASTNDANPDKFKNIAILLFTFFFLIVLPAIVFYLKTQTNKTTELPLNDTLIYGSLLMVSSFFIVLLFDNAVEIIREKIEKCCKDRDTIIYIKYFILAAYLLCAFWINSNIGAVVAIVLSIPLTKYINDLRDN